MLFDKFEGDLKAFEEEEGILVIPYDHIKFHNTLARAEPEKG